MKHYGGIEDYTRCKELIENLQEKKKEIVDNNKRLNLLKEHELKLILEGITIAEFEIEEYWHGNPNNPFNTDNKEG